jgi:hypothetical protein
MELPEIIAILETIHLLDGGTRLILAINPMGELCEIRLNQRVDTSGTNPGRLFFNGQLIKVRSTDEARLLQLLKQTASKPVTFVVPMETEIRIWPHKIFRGDDINKFLRKPLSEKAREFCEQLVTFVESEEYVRGGTKFEITKNRRI